MMSFTTPITLAHAILRNDNEPLLFIDQRKLDIETKAFLTQVADLHPPSDLEAVLEDLSPRSRVMLDSGICPFGFNQLVEKAKGTVVDAKDPVSLARATKNDVELDGARNAHRRDGAAMVTFLAWLDEQRAETMNENFRRPKAGTDPLRDGGEHANAGCFIRYNLWKWSKWGDCALPGQSGHKPSTAKW